MTIDRITRQQADALTALLATLRPDWDKPGIWAAVSKAKDVAPTRDLCVAAIKASGLATNRTPSIIGLEGPHWRGSDHAPKLPEIPPEEKCSICSRRKGSCGVDHMFTSVVASKQTSSEANAYAQMIRADLVARKGDAKAKPAPRDPLPGLICDHCLQPAERLASVYRDGSTRRWCDSCASQQAPTDPEGTGTP